ncbi:MAG: outer membrane beta-barrel protein [Chitinophagaceae bacterium]
MRRLTLVLIIFSCASHYAFSQKSIIKGSISDTSEKKNLTNTVIAVLRKTDSVMVGFTRSDKTGNFTIKNLPAGKSIILVTHPKYADYVDEIDIAANSPIDLGKVILTQKSQLLQEYIVTNAGAIRIKGDTTEFKADSFHMKAGSTVEDLLKQLPGIQVDKNGKITAQGEAVPKVLVDGEEFFSDDPTVVTQNMLSDAVDKVQVYDKKSDQATFTGIDDGQKTKTIDLKLKENRKKGYFGKLEGGTDAQKYWNNSAMFNAFKKKRKFSTFGLMSNTGKTGLNWQENTNYGTSGGLDMIEEGGNIYFSGGSSDDFGGGWDGSFYGEGLPKGWNAGALYSNKWNNDKISFNTGLQYKKLTTEGRGLTQSKYILPDTLYYNNENGSSYSSKYRNTLNGMYEYQLDSSSSLKLTAQGYTGKSTNINNTYSESLDEDGKFVNTSNRRTTALADNKGMNATLFYRKKFKKAGRTISLNMNENYTESHSDGFLNAEYKYYDEAGFVKKSEVTDQQKVRDNIRSGLTSRIVYTEPLSKRSILEFNYSLNNTHGRSGVTTLEKTGTSGGKYQNVIDSLSNDYSLNVLTNSAGVNYRYAKPKKINFSFGGNFSRADFVRRDRKADSSVAYNFLNFFPRANVNFTLPTGANIYVNYSGYTRAPSIDQIQPIKDNSDLLNQKIGNPDLKQSFQQQFRLSYNSYKLLAQRYFYVSMNFNAVSNDFSTINYVDQLGRRISQPVNVQGNYNYGMNGAYEKKLKKPELTLGAYFNINNNHNTNFINSLKNINTSTNIGIGPRLALQKTKKYEISYRPYISFTKSTSSIRPDEPTKYVTQEHNVNGNLSLPWKFEFNTDCTFSIRQKTDAFDRNTNAIRWNARLDRKFLKKDAAVIRLAAFDILDQNIGFQRNVNSNFISERTYDTFRRYVMLSVIWNFSKNGVPQQ